MAWDLPTNFSNGTESVNGIGSLFQYAHYATSDWFGTVIVAVIWVMAFGTGALLNIGRAFASASFIAFVFSIYFVRIEAISPSVPLFLLTATIIGFFWARSERSPSY